MSSSTGDESPRRFRALAMIAAGELFDMSLWFSASAVAPALRAEWRLPALGVIAMLRLRSLPEAARIAHGRR